MNERDLFRMLLSPERPREPRSELVTATSFREDVLSWLKGKCTAESAKPAPAMLRASQLSEVCGRREALCALTGVKPGREKVLVGSRLTMDLGHAVHEWWQNEYLGPMGLLWGYWHCYWCCTTVGPCTMPAQCRCGADRHMAIEVGDPPQLSVMRNITFVETPLRDDELRYTGHPDGLLALNGSDKPNALLELKTISPSGWNRQQGPDPAHVDQVHAYMRLCSVDQAMVVYLNKGAQCQWNQVAGGDLVAGEPNVRVYQVRYVPSHWLRVKKRIADHWRAVDTPPKAEADVRNWCRVCRSATTDLAPSCPVREKCWALDSVT